MILAVDTAAVQMVTEMDSVNETAGSVQVCAEITGVNGTLECAVMNAPIFKGSAKAGIGMKLAPWVFLPL